MTRYEVAIIARRLLLASLIVLMKERSVLQIISISSALLASLAIQHYCQPFKTRTENKVEEIGLMVLIFNYFAQISLAVNPSTGTLRSTSKTET